MSQEEEKISIYNLLYYYLVKDQLEVSPTFNLILHVNSKS
jgi:hypothetical protein